jgi:hypothetical protein
MNTKLADQIVETMQNKTTEELLEIWTTNDRGQWSDAAFDAVLQTLSERNVIIPPQNAAITSSPIPGRYKGVRGWLRFFCITLTIILPLSIIAPLGKITTSDIWHDFRPGFVIAEVLLLILAGFPIYVGVCLWRVRPGAVRKVKIFLWCLFVINTAIIILAFASGPVDDGAKLLASGGYSLVWLAYLSRSKRVEATYGRP